ncbi:MAG: hypothetical protein ACTSVO_02610 [Candidatus Heimdallarchaeaceae archaeon]
MQTGFNILRIIQDVFCNNRRTNIRTKMDTKESSVEGIISRMKLLSEIYWERLKKKDDG